SAAFSNRLLRARILSAEPCHTTQWNSYSHPGARAQRIALVILIERPSQPADMHGHGALDMDVSMSALDPSTDCSRENKRPGRSIASRAGDIPWGGGQSPAGARRR